MVWQTVWYKRHNFNLHHAKNNKTNKQTNKKKKQKKKPEIGLQLNISPSFQCEYFHLSYLLIYLLQLAIFIMLIFHQPMK